MNSILVGVMTGNKQGKILLWPSKNFLFVEISGKFTWCLILKYICICSKLALTDGEINIFYCDCVPSIPVICFQNNCGTFDHVARKKGVHIEFHEYRMVRRINRSSSSHVSTNSETTNLRIFFSLNFLCFVFLQGKSFLLRSKMSI